MHKSIKFPICANGFPCNFKYEKLFVSYSQECVCIVGYKSQGYVLEQFLCGCVNLELLNLINRKKFQEIQYIY